MEIRKVRQEMYQGRSIFDLPLRVTFYARVSTEKFEQVSSLENQIQYYTDFIQRNSNWQYVEGYVDEGISGTSTKNRDSFLRMIADAKKGLFDFIITKEISRFSRSTLDSILYTQELLEHGVGVLFQNDNINTLDTDSEFRLVVMAGVAQDEVRKLSERLKFGFRQSIQNGRVLGNDSIWGYDKKNCRLTVNEEEAAAVRLIFQLYATGEYGLRRLSQELYQRGFASREGNAFNVLTLRHILQNPKYKGWYCGNKTKSIDYRRKKNVPLEESEWVCHPDPAIPALVSEELWNRANTLYKSRKKQLRKSGADFHSRYPYSNKLFCEEHGTPFYRQVLRSGRGEQEVWQCRVYRQRGRAGCAAPQVKSAELDEMMAVLFRETVTEKEELIDKLLEVIGTAEEREKETGKGKHLEREVRQVEIRKEKLLSLNFRGIISDEEFKTRNDGFSRQLETLLLLRESMRAQQEQDGERRTEIRSVLREVMGLTAGIDSELAAAILERVVVKKESSRQKLLLEIQLKSGGEYEAGYDRQTRSFCLTCLKNTTHRPEIRTI